jgi:flagellar protein FlbD
MIALHRLTHPNQVMFLNCDLIQMIEATPDTVVSLTNSSKVIVIEKPWEILGLIRAWRAGIVATALESTAAQADALAEIIHLSGSRPEAVHD